MGDTGLESPPENPEETADSAVGSPASSPAAAPVDLAAALQALASLSPEQLAAMLRLSELVGGR